MVARYRGARTPKKLAFLQPFIPLWVEFNEHISGYYIRRLEVLDSGLILTGSNLFAALYMNELLYLSLINQAIHPQLYDSYVGTLYTFMQINSRSALEAALRRFEWVWLGACGYQMTLGYEAETLNPIRPELHYRFIPLKGFVVTKQGIPGTLILGLAEDKLHEEDVLKVAKKVMRLAIDHVLEGKVLKTRLLFKTSVK